MKPIILLYALFFSISALANPCSEFLPKKIIFKLDQYPKLGTKSETIDGVSNFRAGGSACSYGLAQPTLANLAKVLDWLQTKNPAKITWINLRREPVLYINGRSFSVRNPESPYLNLELPLESAEEVEKVESCLKNQLINFVPTPTERSLLYYEEEDERVLPLQESLMQVETVKEVFGHHVQSGRISAFYRVPLIDEVAPGPTQIDRLLSIFAAQEKEDVFVVNCHAGRGRTTTALAMFLMNQLGLSADAAIDKTDEVINLRTSILKSTSERRKQNAQERYDVLRSLELYFKGTPLVPFSIWLSKKDF